MQATRCSGVTAGTICKHGFPITAPCHGISADVCVPICCDEAISARLFPETGKPQQPAQGKGAAP